MRKRVSSQLQEAKRLVQHRGAHRVVSLYLDLDPERFATAPARASQIRSLLDEATRILDRLEELSHEDKVALREDLKRIDSFLSSSAAPFKGARSLALFCSGPDDLFETIQLSRPVPARVVIEPVPYVEPMIAALQQPLWLVALVNRRLARLLTGSPERLRERERVEGGVHGQHDQGGWSQANYERSVEKDAMDHLRAVAETVNRRFRRERFDRVVVGGPHEVVVRFKELLDSEVRERLAPDEVDVDLGSATETQVRAKVEEIVIEDERRAEREALDRLAEGVGSGRRGAAGLPDTLEALNERRVQTLLLAPGFDGQGQRCPTCGLIVADGGQRCPADGSTMEVVDHLREAVVESAIVQDAEVMVIRHYPDDEPRQGIGVLLRF
jgi:peptide chain release factor subunit 1